jgi:hypothetical protein
MKRALLVALLLAGCNSESEVNVTSVESPGSVSIHADVWVDNWFALYLGDKLILEDSISITTERSFNAESFTFNADYPLQLNFLLKDFKENDSGLEYIGARNQQMGDGGLIAQFFDSATNQLIAYSNPGWKCLVIHEAPLDKACESSTNPVAGEGSCEFRSIEEPMGWKSPDYDDSSWDNAIVHSASSIGPKGGYDGIDWDTNAELMWSSDLETDNTLLCRATIDK